MYQFLYPATLIITLTLLVSCTTPAPPTSPQVMVIATETAETLPPPPTLPTENKSESSATTAITVPVLVATEVPTATDESVDWLTTTTVEEERYILGNPNAPIRLIDFSDFL